MSGLAPDRSPYRMALAPGWSLWRQFGVRMPGFPISLIDGLRLERAACVEADLHAAEARQLAAREALTSLLRAQIFGHTGAARQHWRRLERHLLAGRPQPPDIPDAAVAAAHARWLDAQHECIANTRALTTVYDEEIAERLRLVCSAADDPRLRCAVAWQNPAALTTGLDRLRAAAPGHRPASRHLRLALSYLQRYATKNETIGFFGAMGWGRFAECGRGIEVEGNGAISQAIVTFEHWVPFRLAQLLRARPDVRQHLPIRLHPRMRIERDTLIHGNGRTAPLQPAQGLLLSTCDGRRSAAQIAAALAGHAHSGFTHPDQVLALFDRLTRAGLLVWELPLPPGDRAWPALLAFARSLDVSSAALVEEIEALERDRAGLERDYRAADLHARLVKVDARLAALGGDVASADTAGRTYAGRNALNLDCRQDRELLIGPDVLEALAPALALVLDSARWLTARMGMAMAQIAQALPALAAPGASVPLSEVWLMIQSRPDEIAQMSSGVIASFQHSWERLLLDASCAGEIRHDSESLHSAFASAFPRLHPGWPSACHHSPDVMFAARDLAAFSTGDWFAILGEVHLTGNSLLQRPLNILHPHPHELASAYLGDVTQRELVPQRPSDDIGQRLHYDPPDEQLVHIAYQAGSASSGTTLSIAELTVAHREGELMVFHRRSDLALPLMHFLGPQLRALCVNAFRPFAPRAHRPRVRIDRLVIARESWEIPLEHIPLGSPPDSLANYRALRALQRRHDLPDRVFARFPQERKPVYFDFRNPLLNLMFLPLVRAAIASGAATLALTEMLPAPEQCWMRDRQGERYSMEIRLAAVDSTISGNSDG